MRLRRQGDRSGCDRGAPRLLADLSFALPLNPLSFPAPQIPQDVLLEEPFPIACVVSNAAEQPTGPLRVTVAPQAGAANVMVVGPQSVSVAPVEPGASARVTVRSYPSRRLPLPPPFPGERRGGPLTLRGKPQSP